MIIPENEKELIRRILKGEKVLYAQLVDAYTGPLFNLAYRMTGNRDQAADAVQESFVQAYATLQHYECDRKFFTWIYTICINILRDARRRQTHATKYQGRLAAQAAQAAQDAATPADKPATALLRQERAESLAVAVRRLPESLHEAVALRFFLDLSFSEVAAVLRISENAAKKRVYQALVQLRREVRE